MMRGLRKAVAIVLLDFRRAAFPCCHLSSVSPCVACSRSTMDRWPTRLRLAARYRRTRRFDDYKGRDVVTYVPRGSRIAGKGFSL